MKEEQRERERRKRKLSPTWITMCWNYCKWNNNTFNAENDTYIGIYTSKYIYEE